MINFQPMTNFVVIEQDKIEEKTQGGVILVNPKVHETVVYGIVLAVGKEANEVEIGNRVMFTAFSGSPLKLNGKDYVLISEFEILGVVG